MDAKADIVDASPGITQTLTYQCDVSYRLTLQKGTRSDLSMCFHGVNQHFAEE